MPANEEGREVGDAASARAGDDVVILDEDAVRCRLVIRKSLEKFAVMQPADAGETVLKQADIGQNETAGANADHRHPGRRSQPQIIGRVAIDGFFDIQPPADHGDIRKIAWRFQRGGRRELDSATRGQQVAGRTEHFPVAVDAARAISLVAAQSESIDEQCEGTEGKAARQHEADLQFRAAGRLCRLLHRQ